MSVLLEAIRSPDAVLRYCACDWNRLIAAARAEQLLGRLSYLIEDRGLFDASPPAVQAMMLASRARPAFLQATVQYEARKVLQAVRPLGCDLILLKGAGYAGAGLPLARGRMLSDLDLLVPAEALDAVEQALRQAGWRPKEMSDYDQGYYRDWMHELPPLVHPERGVEVDIHHTLLPRTARLRPQAAALFAVAVPLDTPGLAVLCPPDMLLHTAAHLFYDGEIKGGFKDLLDIHLLILHFGKAPGFWERLAERARLHEFGRPLYYALHFSSVLLGTPVPARAIAGLAPWTPAPMPARLMDALVTRALPPAYPERREPVVCAWLLYIRSHWLRMPPRLLAPHLVRKGLWRLSRAFAGSTVQPR
jgi:hypothetical protein